MTPEQYKTFCKELATLAGISSTMSRRNDFEQRYFLYHQARGVRLRKKYRL